MGALFAVAPLSGASAATFAFTNGDILLGVHAYGGDGATQNVFFNLGSTTNFRDGITTGTLGNIGGTLDTVFGEGWYGRSNVLFGVFGNLNSQPNAGIGSRAAVNGDPSRTTYFSVPVPTPGDGNSLTINSSDGIGAAGTTFSGVENMVIGLTANPDGSATVTQATQPVQFSNSWSAYNGEGNAPFTTWPIGSVNARFGTGEPVRHADIHRITTTNTGASDLGFAVTPLTSHYINTISISPEGTISVIPEPSTGLLGLFAATLLAFRRNRA